MSIQPIHGKNVTYGLAPPVLTISRVERFGIQRSAIRSHSLMDAPQLWAADIRRSRHIGDFTRWKNHDAYVKALERLLRGLKASEEARR